jgi:hypothetical protein
MYGWLARREISNGGARRRTPRPAPFRARNLAYRALLPMSENNKDDWINDLSRHYKIPNLIAGTFANSILLHLRAVRNGGHRHRAVNELVRPHVRNNPNNINWTRAINTIVRVKKGNFSLINSNSNNNSSNGNR